jgi:DNA-binding transcriptional ArsR family regulator
MPDAGDGEKRDRQGHYRLAVMWHPLRQRLARGLVTGEEKGAAGLAAGLDVALGLVTYHLRVLVRRGVLETVAGRDPASPLYRWAADTEWARELIFAESEEEGEDV